MVVTRQNVTDNRTDISRFMVHLTRDDRGEEHGATARANFENMLAPSPLHTAGSLLSARR
jgi:hypothetical protein